MKCTNPELGALVTRYELGALDENEQAAFIDHLIECEFCHNEVYTMAPVMDALRRERESRMRAGIRSVPPERVSRAHPAYWFPRTAQSRLLWAAGAAVLICGLTLVVFHLKGRDEGGRELAGSAPLALRLKVPKAEFQRPSDQAVYRAPEAAAAYERAMTSYEQDRFAEAAQRLDVLCRLEPENVEFAFYRGVSLLLAGRSRDAIPPLKRAAELSGGDRREESLYFLSLALVKWDMPSLALVELGRVVELRGKHAKDAERLIREIRSEMGDGAEQEGRGLGRGIPGARPATATAS